MNYANKMRLCYLQFAKDGPQRVVTKNRDLIEQFLRWKQTHSPWAANRYRIWVTRFQEFVDKTPEDLEFQDFISFSDSLRERFSPMTIQFAHNIIHNYLRFFMEQGRLGFPLYFVRVPRARAESHRAITDPEYEALLGTLTRTDSMSQRNELIVRLLHDTGMRVGELVSLDLDSIEEDSAVVRTEKTVRERRVFWTTETDKLMQEYLEWRETLRPETRALLVGIGGGCAGSRLTSRSVERSIKQLCIKVGIKERISPHSFRHAFIHRMARKGVPDSIIARLVGHSTPHTVAHYTNLSRPETKEYFQKGSGGGERWMRN